MSFSDDEFALALIYGTVPLDAVFYNGASHTWNVAEKEDWAGQVDSLVQALTNVPVVL